LVAERAGNALSSAENDVISWLTALDVEKSRTKPTGYQSAFNQHSINESESLQNAVRTNLSHVIINGKTVD
jgi:hypothetical protein